MLEGLTDEQLVRQHKAQPELQGRSAFLNELFRRHQPRVALWCLRITGDREQAADLAQEVFVRVLRSLGSYREESKFSTWLYAITRHHCISHVQSVARAPVQVEDTVLAEIAEPDSADPLDELEQENQREAGRALLDESLDEMEKNVFILHFGEELPLAAITRLLDLKNTSGAKAYVVSAKRKLKRAVERWRAKQQRSPLRPYDHTGVREGDAREESE